MMSSLPILLVLVHDQALGNAVAANSEAFDVLWSLDFPRDDARDGAAAVAQIADLQPALIVVELDAPARWLPRVHSDPATRRIPVIAIAADEAARQRAEDARANLTFTPEAFIAALPDVLTANASIFAHRIRLNEQCQEPPPALVYKGLREFNEGLYFECHETLEEAWNHESGPVREVYRAILQISIAYYHITRGNYNGALKLFLRSRQWFAPLPDRCQGIDIARLRTDADAARAHLEALGPELIAEFDRSLFKPVIYEEHHP